MCYQLVVKTGISSGEYIIDTDRYRIVGRRKKNSLAGKDKAVLRNRFYVPNKACSVSIIAASSSFIVHILLVQLLALVPALCMYYNTQHIACQV